MTENYGYMGKILWIDLTSKTLTEEEPGEDIYRKYLGGYGLGVYYIYNRITPKCDPLGPDNIIGFCPGLFTGSAAPFTGRYMVCGKSPLTGKGVVADGLTCNGGWGDSNSGGYFSPAIKRAGYDAIFFTGCSEEPVYLLIDGDKKELVEARDLWGKDYKESMDLITKTHGKGYNVALIGKGGENQVLVSGIVNDDGRIAARSGLGAVMGSKKLKALVLKGRKRVVMKDKKAAIQYSKDYRQRLQKSLNNKLVDFALDKMGPISPLMRLMKIPLTIVGKFPKIGSSLYSQFFHKFGTPWFTDVCLEVGDTPVKNYKGSMKDYSRKKVKPLHYTKLMPYKKKSFGCYSCPVQCGAICEVPELNMKETHRPEYETIGAFGPLIMNDNLEIIFELNEYLNMEGVDTISAGGIVSYVMECTEHGLLKQEDFKCKEFPDGFLPEWGKTETIMPLLRLIVNREGIGDILADGSKAASEKIKGSDKYAITANGQELPMHDQRFTRGLGLTYITDPTPGRHTAAGGEFMNLGPVNSFIKGLDLKVSKKPSKMGISQARAAKFYQAFNAMGFCQFSLWCGQYPFFELMKSVFGWDMDLEEVFEIGWRIQILRQMFNAREGAIRHETPGRAFGDPALKEGPLKKVSLDLESYAKEYYSNIGFMENGIPKKEILEHFGFEQCIKDLAIAHGRPTPLINHSKQKK